MNDTVKLHRYEHARATSRPGHTRWSTKAHTGVCAIFAACLSAALLAPAALRAQETRPAPEPPRVLSFGGVQGAFLGVTLKDVTADAVSAMKLPGEYGAIVTQVEPDSPAAKAGLRTNDVILEFGGMRVWSAAQLGQLVRETPPGRTVTLRISRAGEKLNLQASLTPRNEGAVLIPHIEIPPIHITTRGFNFPFTARYRLGVEVETLTSQLASYFGVKQGKGVLVTQVEPDSPGSKAGLKAGDCIVKAGSTDVTSVSDLWDALGTAKDSQLTLSIVRGGHEQTLNAPLGPVWNPAPEFERQVERHIQAIQRQLPRLQQLDNQLKRRLQQLQRGMSTGEV